MWNAELGDGGGNAELGRGGWARLAMRFCRVGLPSRAFGDAFLSWRFAIGSRLLFAAWRQTGRLAIACVPIPPGRDRCSCVLAALARLSAFVGSLRVWPFLAGDLDGGAGDGVTGDAGNGAGGAALVRLYAAALALRRFPRGVRWGCAPQTAPKSLRLSGLSSRCGGVVLVRIRGFCALLRGRIGFEMLSAGSTLGLRAPDCAKESTVEAALPPLWTLFTLRRGCVGANTYPCKRQRPNQRPHACKTRAHGKTCPALIYGRAGRAVLK